MNSMAETRHVIEHVQIIADFELSRDEAHAYYIYARSKHAGITALYLHLDGDDVELDIRCARPFDRIRRITGYLVGNMDKWNNGKLAEEKDRVKHSV